MAASKASDCFVAADSRHSYRWTAASAHGSNRTVPVTIPVPDPDIPVRRQDVETWLLPTYFQKSRRPWMLNTSHREDMGEWNNSASVNGSTTMTEQPDTPNLTVVKLRSRQLLCNVCNSDLKNWLCAKLDLAASSVIRPLTWNIFRSRIGAQTAVRTAPSTKASTTTFQHRNATAS